MLTIFRIVRQEWRFGPVTRACCPCEVGDLALNAPQRGEESRWVRGAGCLQRAINEQNPSKSDGLGTSAPTGPASVSAMERVTEPMVDAPVEDGPRQIGSGRGGRKAGGAPEPSETMGFRDMDARPCQSRAQLAVARDQIPHGVESAPKADQGIASEPGNLVAASPAFGREMIEATDDRRHKGRSLRSSLRVGKPSTWRREVVG